MIFVRRFLDRMAVINEPLCNSAKNLAGMFLMLMTVIIMLQIVFRYVLNDSLIWTEEIAKTMMVWTAFLVAPWAYRRSANVGIEMFVEQLPQRMRMALHLLINLLVIWIVVVFLYESFGFFQRGTTLRAMSLPIQVSWFYAVVPFAFAAMLSVGIELLVRDVLSLYYPNEDFSVPREAAVTGE